MDVPPAESPLPQTAPPGDDQPRLQSRRDFLKAVATASAAGIAGVAAAQTPVKAVPVKATPPPVKAVPVKPAATTPKPSPPPKPAPTPKPTPAPASTVVSGATDIRLKLNGAERTVKLEPRTTLLDALRETCGLTGTKKGCDHGACGACTVHLDGKRVLSCLTLAIAAQGREITTIEGLARGEELHPMQQAFIECDGFQCGFCTPGQIMSAVACVKEGHAKADDATIREWMSGNLCRCGAYPNIVDAIKLAAKGGRA